jgi:hypothetical protein
MCSTPSVKPLDEEELVPQGVSNGVGDNVARGWLWGRRRTRTAGGQVRNAIFGAFGGIVLLALAGCVGDGADVGGTSSSTSSVTSSRGSAPAAVVAQPVKAPAGWRPSADDRMSLRRAELLLAGQCMRALGFEYWDPALNEGPGWDLPYVIDDPAWAAAHGYGGDRQRRIQAEQAADPNARYAESLPPSRRNAYETALFGTDGSALSASLPDGSEFTTSSDGCVSDARRSLFGDLKTWFIGDTLDLNLDTVLAPRIQADPRYQQHLAQWVGCVALAGHEVDTPTQLRRSGAERSRGQPPVVADRIERELAVIEARCAVSSGLGSTARQLDAIHRAAAEHEFATLIEPLRAMQHAALPRARALADETVPAGR